jgi:antitoxin component YwqK of YwqJK toxin-antitoxin module
MSRTKTILTILKQTKAQGRVYSEEISQDPWEVLNLGFYPNGQAYFELRFQDGKLHGLAKFWHPDGHVASEEMFNKNFLHGVQKFWHPNGTLQSESQYINNMYAGQHRTFYDNGRMAFEGFYRNNQPDGGYMLWHPNGQIKERGEYLEGKLHGLRKEFDEQGRLKALELYVRGVRYHGRIKKVLKEHKMSAAIVMKTDNTALRRIFLEEIGYERLLKEADYCVLDKQGEYELLKVHWHTDEEPLVLVKVKCPSTGAFYTLRVPPHVTTVAEAVAWTFGLNSEEYQPQEEA